MNLRVLVAVADGTEEIEAVTVIDLLRRAGVSVHVASVSGMAEIRASRGCRLVADGLVEDAAPDGWDAVICPGGMPGAEALRASAPLEERIRRCLADGGTAAAICAAPAVVFADMGLLAGKRATSYPSFADRIEGWVDEPVVEDGPFVTSQGPATAMAFGLRLVERLVGPEARAKLAKALLYTS